MRPHLLVGFTIVAKNAVLFLKETALPQILIREKLWNDLLTVARRRRQRAEALAESVLLEYLQRLADEDLLHKSERAGRRTKFPIGETEQVIRKWRRNRKVNRLGLR